MASIQFENFNWKFKQMVFAIHIPKKMQEQLKTPTTNRTKFQMDHVASLKPKNLIRC